MDKLLDLTRCRCTILTCKEVQGKKCDGCDTGAHIKCSCSLEMKLPKLELFFIKAQRDKVGDISSVQISNKDVKESARLDDLEVRKEREVKKAVDHEKAKQSAKIPSKEVQEFFADGEGAGDDFSQPDKDEAYEIKVTEPQKTSRNMTPIPELALASIRHGVEDRPAAAIATATLRDYGIITETDLSQVIDASKVRRAKQHCMLESQDRATLQNQEEEIICLFFDGRRDRTKVMLFNEQTGKFYQSVKTEEHYSVTKEPSGQYAFHFTPEEATKEIPHAKQIAIRIVRWLAENNSLDSLKAIGGDSTNVNTGWKAGVMAWVEKLLGRRLIWIVCGLHVNELPLRSLIVNLDGPTCSDSGFSGPLGKALEKVEYLPLNPDFEKIASEELPKMSEEVINDLSTDQKHSFRLWEAITSGEMSADLAALSCGALDHARWLTTANQFCVLWTKKHGFEGENLENLRMIVGWIIGSYYPMWFQLKIHHHWIKGPEHILHQIILWREQPELAMEFTHETIQRGAYYAHSEHLLQSLLCSDDEDERRFAVKEIIQLRADNQKRLENPKPKKQGKAKQKADAQDSNVRSRINPELNLEATSLTNLISWNKDVYEPILTMKLSDDQLRQFFGKAMDVPVLGLHTQSIERCVKQVIEPETYNIQ